MVTDANSPDCLRLRGRSLAGSRRGCYHPRPRGDGRSPPSGRTDRFARCPSRPRAARDVRRPFPRSLDRARRAGRRRPHADWRLVESKSHGTFALLFGAGFAIQLRQAEARGSSFAGFYLRRLAVLALFGLAAHALFGFNVLLGYAVWGVPLLAIRRWSSRALLMTALVSALPVALFDLVATQYPTTRAAGRRQRSESRASGDRCQCESRRQGGRGTVEL